MWIIYETVSVQTWSPNARTQCHFHTIPYRFQSSVAATPTPELRRSPTRCLVTMPFAGNLLYSFSIYFPPPASSAWVYFLNASSVSQSGPIYWWPAISFIQKSRKKTKLRFTIRRYCGCHKFHGKLRWDKSNLFQF